MAQVIDLFCGIGGLTNGLIRAGFEVVAGVDLDESCRFAYEANNNSKFIGKSVSELSGDELTSLYKHDEIKILVGCAPCQPFSNHQKNKENRSTHKDWGLLYDFLRLVTESRPDIVSMENVPSLSSERVFHDFLEGLNGLGYHVTYQIVNTVKLGIPQRRYRLILLASLFGEISFIEPNYPIRTVRDAIGDLPAISAGETHPDDPLHVSGELSQINMDRIRHSTPGGTWESWPVSLLPECYKKESGKTYKSVYGRMKWDSVAPTITTQFYRYGTGRFGHPEQDRALSLREGALIQTFPENYQLLKSDTKISYSAIGRQIGNAVPPRLGEYIGTCIMNHLQNI